MSKRTSEQAGVQIRMLGNQGKYRNGEIYTVGIDEANKLTGYGMAVLVSGANPEDEKAAPEAAVGEGN